ncbi:MAG: hypothetical protein CBB79_07070 [Synechococcus sp. TMED19]|nr:MAG: hypothetical protein CBB79_07070 [Synechococcus sp. TMED19]
MSLVVGVPAIVSAGPSPWWEHYERHDKYRCDGDEELLIERNDAQASLYMGGYKMNLFRDKHSPLFKRYISDRLKLTVSGDEVELEDQLSRRRCQRFEQA